MDAAFDYDTTNLVALREELKLLNESALASGLIGVRDGRPVMPSRARRAGTGARGKIAEGKIAKGKGAKPKSARADSSQVEPVEAKATKTKAAKGKTTKSKAEAAAATPAEGDTGKAGATRLLAMAGRAAGDDSQTVPGTDFTEAGVVRLLAHLRKRRSKGYKFLQRVYRFLTRPVTMGTHTSAGVSVERLQLVSRQLHEIEADGWQQFRSVHAARRGTRAAAAAAARPTKSRAARPKAAKAESTARPAAKSGARKKTTKRETS